MRNQKAGTAPASAEPETLEAVAWQWSRWPADAHQELEMVASAAAALALETAGARLAPCVSGRGPPAPTRIER